MMGTIEEPAYSQPLPILLPLTVRVPQSKLGGSLGHPIFTWLSWWHWWAIIGGQHLVGNNMKAIFVAALLVAPALTQVSKPSIIMIHHKQNQELWREDGRCGADHPLADGSPGFLFHIFFSRFFGFWKPTALLGLSKNFL